MHRLLRRQLRKHLGVEDEVPAALQAFVAAVDAAYADFDSDRAMLERSDLSEHAKQILYLRFFGDMTQAEIGKIIGISQVHVSRLLRASLNQLREAEKRAAALV